MGKNTILNEGILAGRLWGQKSNKPFSEGLVTLNTVKAEGTEKTFKLYDGNGTEINQPQTYSDENGYFALVFCWDATKVHFRLRDSNTPFRATVTNLKDSHPAMGQREVLTGDLHLCVSLRRIADGTGKIPEISIKGGSPQVAQELYQTFRQVKLPSIIITVMRPSLEFYSFLAWKEWNVPE